VSAAGHFHLGRSEKTEHGVDCFSVHSVKSKNMTARKSFNPNTEDGRVILHELRSELQGRRGVVILKLLALSLPLTSQHSERPFRLLWTLPCEGKTLVQICTPPFTVAKRTPTRGEAVLQFVPSRTEFPEIGKESTDTLLRAVVVNSKAGVGYEPAPPGMPGFSGIPPQPGLPPGTSAAMPARSAAMHGTFQHLPIVVSAPNSNSSSGSARPPIPFHHLAGRGPSASAVGRDPSVHLPAPPAVIPVPMPGNRTDSVADARNMAAAYGRGMPVYHQGYGGGYPWDMPQDMPMHGQARSFVSYEGRYPVQYVAAAPRYIRVEGPPGQYPPQDDGMRLPQYPPGSEQSQYMPRNGNDVRNMPEAAYTGQQHFAPYTGGHETAAKQTFMPQGGQQSSSSGPTTSGSGTGSAPGSHHSGARTLGAPRAPVQYQVQQAPHGHAYPTPRPTHVVQSEMQFIRGGVKRPRSNGSSAQGTPEQQKRAAQDDRARQFTVPSSTGGFRNLSPGGNGFANSDGGVSLNGLSGLGAAINAGWATGGGSDAMCSTSPAVPNCMPAAMPAPVQPKGE